MASYTAEGTQDAEVPGDSAPVSAEDADSRPSSDVPAAPPAGDAPAVTAPVADSAADAAPEGAAPAGDGTEDDADEDDEASRADGADDFTDAGSADAGSADDESAADESAGYGDADGDDGDYAEDEHYGDRDYRDGDYADDEYRDGEYSDGDYGDGDYGDNGRDYEDDYYDEDAPHERPKVSKLAVVALITGIIPLVPIALITGIVALFGIRRSGRRGQGMAVTALFFAVGWVVLAAGVGVIAHYTHDFKKPVKVVYSEASVFKLQEGECINTANGQQVTIVSCTTPHDAEVFGTFTLPAGQWPGTSAIQQEASNGCATRLTGYINPQLAISLTQTYVYPTQGDWAAGTRTVICEVRPLSGQLSQSVRGASASSSS
ncbi:MAG TPA: septum formation family protein [Trebonia sp.]|jgi:hypothetical protein|nr:septum formation family protein [Trebonia sp.]